MYVFLFLLSHFVVAVAAAAAAAVASVGARVAMLCKWKMQCWPFIRKQNIHRRFLALFSWSYHHQHRHRRRRFFCSGWLLSSSTFFFFFFAFASFVVVDARELQSFTSYYYRNIFIVSMLERDGIERAIVQVHILSLLLVHRIDRKMHSNPSKDKSTKFMNMLYRPRPTLAMHLPVIILNILKLFRRCRGIVRRLQWPVQNRPATARRRRYKIKQFFFWFSCNFKGEEVARPMFSVVRVYFCVFLL